MSMGSEFLSDYAWEIEEAKNYADAIWYEAQGKVWETKDGRLLHVEEMTTSHIKNTIAYIQRNWDIELYQPWIDVFNDELERRNNEKYKPPA